MRTEGAAVVPAASTLAATAAIIFLHGSGDTGRGVRSWVESLGDPEPRLRAAHGIAMQVRFGTSSFFCTRKFSIKTPRQRSDAILATGVCLRGRCWCVCFEGGN